MVYADLVTLSAAQAALSDLDAGQLADLPACLSAVSQHLSARYRRGMAATTIVEEHEIGMNRTLRFNHRPVIQVLKVEADQVPLLRISNTGALVTEAIVTLNVQGEADALAATGITLTSTTMGVEATPIVLTWATYPTVDQLVAAIVAAGGGWTAVKATNGTDVPDLGVRPTATILPDGGGRSAIGVGVQLWAYTRVLNDWVFKKNELVVFEWRSAGYRFPDRTWGTDNRTTRFRTTYLAGNLTVPADVQRATILTIRDVLDRTSREGGLSSLRAEDYSLVFDTMGGIPAAAKSLLSRYQDRGL
ncbi:MAG: hypothetical protein P4L84_35040 [Isosphaeraceae bacterium]|nr:hypothetical protein [Isosphaeraceae bacterium]